MKKPEAAYIIVGKIGAPYGVRGWLKVHSYTETTATLLTYNPWHLKQDNDVWTPISIEDGRPHGASLVAKFAGVDTPEKARLYTGKTIGITRDQLPKLNKNEFYWSDLQGLMVINKAGIPLGKVIYLIETGSNDVLVINHDGKEVAIPYLPDSVILDVDLEKKEIRVDWELTDYR